MVNIANHTKIIQIDDNTRHIVDIETGEVLHVQRRIKDIWKQDDERCIVYKPKDKKPKAKNKKNTPTNPDFICVFRDNWNDLVKKKALTFTERGFLMSLIGFTDWRSNILVNPDTREVLNESRLAVLLMCDRDTVSLHTNALWKKGLLGIISTGPRSEKKYVLNSNIAIYGKFLKDTTTQEVFESMDYKPLVQIVFSAPKD